MINSVEGGDMVMEAGRVLKEREEEVVVAEKRVNVTNIDK